MRFQTQCVMKILVFNYIILCNVQKILFEFLGRYRRIIYFFISFYFYFIDNERTDIN